MKSLAIVLSFLTKPSRRRNLVTLAKLVIAFIVIVLLFTLTFHYLMENEGQEHSWMTGLYWVMVVMSTLGLGDITFQSDIGRLFSVVVLLSGTFFMLVLLPFSFIQFFYVPWMEDQAESRAPRELSPKFSGHVILTNYSAIETSLIRMLKRASIPYVVIVGELVEALRLHDDGVSVMLGDIDDLQTYLKARAKSAALVVATRRDTTNTNISFTVREISELVSIVSTASSPASVDILELAGANQVLQLGDMLGQVLARRVLVRDSKSHVVGEFGDLLIAEAAVGGTPLVGRNLRDIRLSEHARVNIVGIWGRGHFELAGPETMLEESSVLLLAGSRQDLDEYDELFCLYGATEAPVVIIGGGRVGRSAARAMQQQGIDYRLVEKDPGRIREQENYVFGDAAELEVLQQAGIMNCSSVLITTHDDDVNVYLTIYCRRLRPDVQILVRANQDRNVSTLHRAGADFAMSYASTGASSLFNVLKRGKLLFLAEGLDVFQVPVPHSLVGQTLAGYKFRQSTGCNVVAIERPDGMDANPDPHRPLAAGDHLIIVGDTESEERFFAVTQ